MAVPSAVITDHLIAAGETVFHILGHNHVEQAHMTSAAKPGLVGTLTYPVASSQDEAPGRTGAANVESRNQPKAHGEN